MPYAAALHTAIEQGATTAEGARDVHMEPFLKECLDKKNGMCPSNAY